MLEMVERRDDCYFEAFCEALEESENGGVVRRYFQKYRVWYYML